MKKISLIFTIIAFASCANRKVINEAFTEKTPGFKKVYPAKTNVCIDSVKKSLKEMGTGVDEVKGERIISERWSFMEYVEAYGSYHQASAANFNLVAKLYIDVTESDKNSCQIRVAKVRAWENSVEYETMDPDQVLQKIVTPFFKNIDEHVK